MHRFNWFTWQLITITVHLLLLWLWIQVYHVRGSWVGRWKDYLITYFSYLALRFLNLEILLYLELILKGWRLLIFKIFLVKISEIQHRIIINFFLFKHNLMILFILINIWLLDFYLCSFLFSFRILHPVTISHVFRNLKKVHASFVRFTLVECKYITLSWSLITGICMVELK